MGAGILHTIVFNRALGLVRPKDVDLELFEITYVSVYVSKYLAALVLFQAVNFESIFFPSAYHCLHATSI